MILVSAKKGNNSCLIATHLRLVSNKEIAVIGLLHWIQKNKIYLLQGHHIFRTYQFFVNYESFSSIFFYNFNMIFHTPLEKLYFKNPTLLQIFEKKMHSFSRNISLKS